MLVSAEFLLAAILGASGYGIFSIAFALVLVIPALCQLGLNFGIVQYLGIYREERDEASIASVARISLAIVLFVGLLAGLLIYILRQWLALNIFDAPELVPVFLVISLIVPVESVNQCCSAVFKGLRKFRHHVLAQDFIRNGTLLAGIPLVALLNLDLPFVFAMMLSGSVLASCISLVSLNRSLALCSRKSQHAPVVRKLVSFSYLLFFWQVLQKTSNQLMVLIAGAILLKPEVGVLALAVRFATLLNFPQSVVNATTPVEFARYWHRREPERIARLLQSLALVLSALAIPYLLFVGANSEAIFAAFGEQYAGFGWVLSILLLAKAVDVGLGPVGQILVACRRRKTVFFIGVLDLALQLLIVVPFMLAWGLLGAALGNALRSAAVFFVRHGVLFWQTGIHAFGLKIGILFATGLGLALLIWRLSLFEHGLWTQLTYSFVAVVCIVGISWILLAKEELVLGLLGKRLRT